MYCLWIRSFDIIQSSWNMFGSIFFMQWRIWSGCSGCIHPLSSDSTFSFSKIKYSNKYFFLNFCFFKKKWRKSNFPLLHYPFCWKWSMRAFYHSQGSWFLPGLTFVFLFRRRIGLETYHKSVFSVTHTLAPVRFEILLKTLEKYSVTQPLTFPIWVYAFMAYNFDVVFTFSPYA